MEKNTPQELDAWITNRLREIAGTYGVSFPEGLSGDDTLFSLINSLSALGDIVILVDEYDKVLSDNIASGDAEGLRDVLGNFYQVMKTQSSHIRFALITGVTKFSFVTKMNNLSDITMWAEYATMFGYTQEELETYFAPYLAAGRKALGISQKEYLGRLKEMYDGYTFHIRSTSVYNPVSVGSLFSRGGMDFVGYWVKTGNTKLLMDAAKRVNFNILSDVSLPVLPSRMGSFDILDFSPVWGKGRKLGAVDLLVLLFQTGYLTIKGVESASGAYHFGFPSIEVRQAFNASLLSAFWEGDADTLSQGESGVLDAFAAGDTAKAIAALQILFAGVPNTITIDAEKYYQSLVYMVLASSRAKNVQVEDATNVGRIDMVREEAKHLYLIEFKFGTREENALKQIKTKGYVEKYLDRKGKKVIHLVGINFSKEKRNIEGWREEILF